MLAIARNGSGSVALAKLTLPVSTEASSKSRISTCVDQCIQVTQIVLEQARTTQGIKQVETEITKIRVITNKDVKVKSVNSITCAKLL